MRALSWVIKKLWLLLAILLVLVAVVLSLLRYSLPYLPDLTQPLESELESRFQQPVGINDLSMGWSAEGPSVVLENVSLSAGDNAPVRFDVGEVHVVLNFWQSIVQQQLVADQFILNRANVGIDLKELQQVTDENTFDIDSLSDLFLQQFEKFSIHQGRLFLTNLRGETRQIDLERVSWVNDGASHRAVGSLRMDDFATNALDIIVDLKGDSWSDLTGQFYVNAENVDISPWLEERLGDIDVQASDVNFTGWLDMRNGELFEGLLQLRQNRISWQYKKDDEVHWLDIPSGKVILRPIENGWLMNSLPVTLESSSGKVTFPRVAWQNRNGIHDISVSTVPLANVAALTGLLPETMKSMDIWRQKTAVEGELDVQFRQHPVTGAQWHIEGRALSFDATDTTPSVSGLNASMSQLSTAGTWRVYGSDVSLASSHLSNEKAWSVDALDLSGNWQASASEWSVSLTKAQADMRDLRLTGRAKLSGKTEPNSSAPRIRVDSFIHSIQPFSVETARELLPQIMGDEVQSYLSGALQSGQLNGIESVWRGTLNDVSSNSLASVFNARVDFDSLDYQFQPDWPALIDTPVHLDFYQSGLTMHANSGQVGNVNVHNVSAQIPELTDSTTGLQIKANVSGQAEQLHEVFKNSPLNSITETFNQLHPKGQIEGRMNLKVPMNGSTDVGVFVEAPLAGVDVTVDAINQRFSVTSGVLTINDAKVSTADLSMDWYGMPVNASVNGIENASGYELIIETAFDWQTEPLFNEFPYDQWEEFFYGAVNGEASVALNFSGNDVNVEANGQYDLTGLETYLPAPLKKNFGEGWQFEFALEGNKNDYAVNGRIGDRLNFDGEWQLGSAGWTEATLTVGDGVTANKLNQGFAVVAELPMADIGRWYSLIYALAGGGKVTQNEGSRVTHSSWLPDSIRVSTPELKWEDQSFGAAEVRSWPGENQWQVQVDSDKAVLNVVIPNQFMQQGIDVRADYLVLSTDIEVPGSTGDDEQQWSWLGKIPPVTVNCRSCRINKHNLGEVELAISPISSPANAQGLSIDKFNVTRNGDRLNATGIWRYQNGQAFSRMSGNLKTSDLGDSLRQFGVETAIRDSSADISFNLSWDDHLHQPSWPSLDGEMSWSLGKGYLAEVSDGGARIFSILSLDSILRKLTLDFRDIFSQGMFFTELSGNAAIEDGVAQTDDTRLLGSAGDMDIRGWTDMASGKLDYNLTYAPKVTSSLPVILAWMVNPPSGLAALLIDKVLHDAKVISKLRYEVTGTLDNPEVKEIERDSRPVDLPELEEGSNNSEVKNDDGATDSATNEQPL